MTKIEDLKIYIVDTNSQMTSAMRVAFLEEKNVVVIKDDIINFFQEHKDEIDCLVSPANSYGIMSGGYDAALSDILGWGFQKKVQAYIKEHYYGEQPVGTSFIIKTDIPGLSLIHTPTMIRPSKIKDEMVVYHCMRSTIICALQNDVKCIVMPVFGGACGCVQPSSAANMMRSGYKQFFKRIELGDYSSTTN